MQNSCQNDIKVLNISNIFTQLTCISVFSSLSATRTPHEEHTHACDENESENHKQQCTD